MERICFRLQLKPELVDEYIERHASVWPEMREALTAAGWSNYTLFVDKGDCALIGYLESEDFQRARELMAESPVNDRWQSEMREFFLDTADATPDRAFVQLVEVFHLQ